MLYFWSKLIENFNSVCKNKSNLVFKEQLPKIYDLSVLHESLYYYYYYIILRAKLYTEI